MIKKMKNIKFEWFENTSTLVMEDKDGGSFFLTLGECVKLKDFLDVIVDKFSERGIVR